MDHTTKTLFLLILICTCIIAGCKKSTPAQASIVGAWTFNGIEEKLYVNNVVTYDTFIASGTGPLAITFGANGFYTELTATGTIGSAYTLSGTTLSLFDTFGHADYWEKLNVPNLTANSFSIVDTEFHSSDSVGLILETFTR